MIHYLAIGALLGLSAGLSPGPLLALVISETLQHGVQSGIKVALAPIITDFPIILFTFWVLKRLTHVDVLLGIIALLGGSVIFKMGSDCLRQQAPDLQTKPVHSNSLAKGVWANALNPQPYLFWLTVGVTLISEAALVGKTAVAAFIGSFYLLLVGSKIILALVVGRSRTFLSGKIYLYTLRFLGLCLIVFALALFYNGINELVNFIP